GYDTSLAIDGERVKVAVFAVLAAYSTDRLEAVRNASADVAIIASCNGVDHLSCTTVLIDGCRRIARGDCRGHLVEVVHRYRNRSFAGVATGICSHNGEIVLTELFEIERTGSQGHDAGSSVDHQQVCGIVLARLQAVGQSRAVVGLGDVEL